MIKKAVIPAAGLGTRLLPATKHQPKEMLPIFAVDASGQICLKPIIQIVFEVLYENGFREFCFIVGRNKRSIEDHFTLDIDFVKYLAEKNKFNFAKEMDQFYDKLRNAHIAFINQPEPRGFGDAVYLAKSFTSDEAFLVHAGDDLIISKNNSCLNRLKKTFEKYNADAAFCVEKVHDPRRYGVIQGRKIGEKLYRVIEVQEKPKRPKSDLAIIAVYIFNRRVYNCIEQIKYAYDELQLTDAIQKLLDDNGDVYAVELDSDEKRIDVGTPESYWFALSLTKRLSERK